MRRVRHQVAFEIALLLLGCLSAPSLSLHAQTASTSRGVALVGPPASSPPPGPYYALLIGNSHYRHLGPDGNLLTPANDARELATLLHDRYGFETQLLLDADRNQILTALVDYRKSLAENANLLIYYAGHGHHDRDAEEAYWLPVDAYPENNANWISADDITRDLRAMPSLHVLVISDSCYSGYLTGGRAVDARIDPRERHALLAKLLSSKSRMLMSSGRDEPVADDGAPGHSFFAAALLESLRNMREDTFTGSELFYNYLQPKVGGSSAQLPQYTWILNSGHRYGDFLFTRRPGLAAPGDAPAPPAAATAAADISSPSLPSTPAIGWALTVSGTLLHTEDGVTWERRNRWKGSSLGNTLTFVTPQSGWIIENGTDLLHTEDGGHSWRVQLTHKDLQSVAFVTAQSGWVIAKHTLLHTEDAGHTWVEQLHGDTSPEGIAFADPQSAWLVGIASIVHTGNAGRLWLPQSFSTGRMDAFTSAAFTSPQEGWIVGAMGVILHTVDGGLHWREQTSGVPGVLFSVSFPTPLSGWVAGTQGVILHTEDGGSHWVRQNSQTTNTLFSITFVDEHAGWAVGDGGVLHTEDGGATWKRQYQDDYETVRSLAIFKQP